MGDTATLFKTTSNLIGELGGTRHSLESGKHTPFSPYASSGGTWESVGEDVWGGQSIIEWIRIFAID